ncbi:MAG: AAA family ATPase [Bacteroidales bacterium]|nr:AAA family ATPase [Bacteroidales bacterium]
MKTEIKNKIVKEFESYLDQHKMSQNSFAKKSGINVSYLSAMRSGEYVINAGGGKKVPISDKYFETLADFLGMKTEKVYWQTVPTMQMQRILATLQDAREFGYTNVIIGETGCGKTYVSNIFAKANPIDVVLVTVSQSDNIGDLLDKILDKLKIGSGKTKSKKLRDIVSALRARKFDGGKPMIIFDEAEYMKQPALCAMKEFYDNLIGICSIVMAGTDQLTRNLERLRRRNKDGIPQLYRRIKFGIRVLPSIDRTFKQFLNDVEDKDLIRFIRTNCDNYGELHDVLVPAMREADRTGTPLTEKFVRTILNFM